MRLFNDEVIGWDKLGITVIYFDKLQNFDTREVEKQLDLQLSLKGYSTKTKKAYIGHVIRFLEFTDKKLENSVSTDVEKYLHYLISSRKVSHIYANQAISAIKFYYTNILKRGKIINNIPRPKKEKKLPNILSQEEVLSILNSIKNYKHKSILYLVYSAGLRVG